MIVYEKKTRRDFFSSSGFCLSFLVSIGAVFSVVSVFLGYFLNYIISSADYWLVTLTGLFCLAFLIVAGALAILCFVYVPQYFFGTFGVKSTINNSLGMCVYEGWHIRKLKENGGLISLSEELNPVDTNSNLNPYIYNGWHIRKLSERGVIYFSNKFNSMYVNEKKYNHKGRIFYKKIEGIDIRKRAALSASLISLATAFSLIICFVKELHVHELDFKNLGVENIFYGLLCLAMAACYRMLCSIVSLFHCDCFRVQSCFGAL